MALYYFHMVDDQRTQDEEGADLPDLVAAHHRAIFEARALAADRIRTEGRLALLYRIEIEHGGETVAIVNFSDAVTIE